ncbi:hypothetical protein AAA021_06420 [Collinsella sp. CLA-JM-H32]|uniref:hypothetical protein n=1 Tax=Collinsella sp. CLA-JM-H32 TaxID=3136225 RepID=UPI0032C02F5E
MASSAPQEGLPFPVCHRHVHADSNCSMRVVLFTKPADAQSSVHHILPMCMGGCPHRHMVSGVRRCPWFKDDPDAYVLAKTRTARKSRQ